MPLPIPDASALLSRKLLIVTGKGGTGKTTVSALLARTAARLGKRTLIVQIETALGAAPLFGTAPADYDVRPIGTNLFLVNVQAREAFREYVLMQIKFKSLYNAVFGNRLVRSFIEAVPGLAELMSIGKVYVLARDYDLTIVDAPATGHGVSLLQIPSVVASAVRIGPLRTHSEAIEKILKDGSHTAVLITSLAEEMPVAETLELESLLRETLGVSVAGVVVNQVLQPLEDGERRTGRNRIVSKEWEPLATLARVHSERATLQRRFINTLHDELPGLPFWEIPFSFERRLTLEILDALAADLFPSP